MLKKIILRGLSGIPIGVFISSTIILMYSLFYGELILTHSVDNMSPLKFYVTQYIVSMIIGFVFATCSIIFEIDSWSLAKQTAMHFVITLIVFLPCSIIAKWVEFDFISILIYILIFVIIYIAIWVIQYFIWKHKIDKLNQKLNER